MTSTRDPSPSTAASRDSIGRAAMNAAAPGVPDLLESTLGNLSPNTVRRVYEQIWGDLYQDPALSLRERTIATIAGLTAIGGGETNLKLQVRVALNAGMTPAQIIALIEHMATVAGFPRAQAALAAASEVFSQRGVAAQPGNRSPGGHAAAAGGHSGAGDKHWR